MSRIPKEVTSHVNEQNVSHPSLPPTLQNTIQRLHSRSDPQVITSTSQLPKIKLPSHIQLPPILKNSRASLSVTQSGEISQNVHAEGEKPVKKVRLKSFSLQILNFKQFLKS